MLTLLGQALWMTFLGATGAAIGASAGPGEAKTVLKQLGQIPHSGYSEGLDFHDGFLWNALPKEIVKISPEDGSVVARYTPATEYSESVTWFKGSLWNLSFSDNGIYKGLLKGDKLVFKRVGSVPEVHGWGITHDGSQIIATGDYSNKLYFLDPSTAKVVRTLVTDKTALEDLAWDGRGIWTSSFTSHRGRIFRIDPQSGKSGPLYSLPDPESCPIVDGIAVDGKTLWVTGKHCSAIYHFQLPL
jgi:glutamine cyclotransferase